MDRADILSRIHNAYSDEAWDYGSEDPEVMEYQNVADEQLTDFQLSNDVELNTAYQSLDEDAQKIFRESLKEQRHAEYEARLARETQEQQEFEDYYASHGPNPEAITIDYLDEDMEEGQAINAAAYDINIDDYLDQPGGLNTVVFAESLPEELSSTTFTPQKGDTDLSSLSEDEAELMNVIEAQRLPTYTPGLRSVNDARLLQNALKDARKQTEAASKGKKGAAFISEETLENVREIYRDPDLSRASFQKSFVDGRYDHVMGTLNDDASNLKKWQTSSTVEGAYAELMRGIDRQLFEKTFGDEDWAKRYKAYKNHANKTASVWAGAASPWDPIPIYGPADLGGKREIVGWDTTYRDAALDAQKKRSMINVKLGNQPTVKQSLAEELRQPDKGIARRIPLIGGVVEFRHLDELNSLAQLDYEARVAGKESPLNASQRRTLEAGIAQIMQETLVGDRTSTKTVDILIDMVPYAMTYGAASKAVTAGLGKFATTQAGRRLVANAAYQNLLANPTWLGATGRATLKGAGVLGKDALIAALGSTADVGGLLRGAAERSFDPGAIRSEITEDFKLAYDYAERPGKELDMNALQMAWGSNFLEMFGESGTGHISGLIGASRSATAAVITRMAKKLKIPESKAAAYVRELEKNFNANPKVQAAMKEIQKFEKGTERSKQALKRFGYDGPLGEIWEESETAALQAVFGTDEEYQDMKIGDRIRALGDFKTWDPTRGGSIEDRVALVGALTIPALPGFASGAQGVYRDVSDAIDTIYAETDAARTEEIIGEKKAAKVEAAADKKADAKLEEIATEEAGATVEDTTDPFMAPVETPKIDTEGVQIPEGTSGSASAETAANRILENVGADSLSPRATEVRALQEKLKDMTPEERQAFDSDPEVQKILLESQATIEQRQADAEKQLDVSIALRQEARIKLAEAEAAGETGAELKKRQTNLDTAEAMARGAELQYQAASNQTLDQIAGPQILQVLDGYVAPDVESEARGPEPKVEDKAPIEEPPEIEGPMPLEAEGVSQMTPEEEVRSAEDKLEKAERQLEKRKKVHQRKVDAARRKNAQIKKENAAKRKENKKAGKPLNEGLKPLVKIPAPPSASGVEKLTDAVAQARKTQSEAVKTAENEAFRARQEEYVDLLQQIKNAPEGEDTTALETQAAELKKELTGETRRRAAEARRLKNRLEVQVALAEDPQGAASTLAARSAARERALRERKIESLNEVAAVARRNIETLTKRLKALGKRTETNRVQHIADTNLLKQQKAYLARVEQRTEVERGAMEREAEAARKNLNRLRDTYTNYSTRRLAELGRFERRMLSRSPVGALRRLAFGTTRKRVQKSIEALQNGLLDTQTQEDFDTLVEYMYSEALTAKKAPNRITNFVHRALAAYVAPGRFSGGGLGDFARILRNMGGLDVRAMDFADVARKAWAAERVGGEAAAKRSIAESLTEAFGTYRVATAAQIETLTEQAEELQRVRGADFMTTDASGYPMFRMVGSEKAFDAAGRELLQAGVIRKIAGDSKANEAIVEHAQNDEFVVFTNENGAVVEYKRVVEVLKDLLGNLMEEDRIERLAKQVVASFDGSPDQQVHIIPSMLVTDAQEWAAGMGYNTERIEMAQIRGFNIIANDGTRHIFMGIDADGIDVIEETAEIIIKEHDTGEIDFAEGAVQFVKMVAGAKEALITRRLELKDKRTDLVDLPGLEVPMTYGELDDMFAAIINRPASEYPAMYREFISKNVAMLASKAYRKNEKGADEYRAIQTNADYRTLLEVLTKSVPSRKEFRVLFDDTLNVFIPANTWSQLGLSPGSAMLDLLQSTTKEERRGASDLKAGMARAEAKALKEGRQFNIIKPIEMFEEDDPKMQAEVERILKERAENRAERQRTRFRKGTPIKYREDGTFERGTKEEEERRTIAHDKFNRLFPSFNRNAGWKELHLMLSQADAQRIIDSADSEWRRTKAHSTQWKESEAYREKHPFSPMTNDDLYYIIEKLAPLSSLMYTDEAGMRRLTSVWDFQWLQDVLGFDPATDFPVSKSGSRQSPMTTKEGRVEVLRRILRLYQSPEYLNQVWNRMDVGLGQIPTIKERQAAEGEAPEPQAPIEGATHTQQAIENLFDDTDLDDIFGDDLSPSLQTGQVDVAPDPIQILAEKAAGLVTFKLMEGMNSTDENKKIVVSTAAVRDAITSLATRIQGRIPADPEGRARFWKMFYRTFTQDDDAIPIPPNVPTFVKAEGSDLRFWRMSLIEKTFVNRIAAGISARLDTQNDADGALLGMQETRGVDSQPEVEGQAPPTDNDFDNNDGAASPAALQIMESDQKGIEIRRVLAADNTTSFVSAIDQRMLVDIFDMTKDQVEAAMMSDEAFQRYLRTQSANSIEEEMKNTMRNVPGFTRKHLKNIYSVYRELKSIRVGAMFTSYDSDENKGRYYDIRLYKPKLHQQMARHIQSKLQGELELMEAAELFSGMISDVSDLVKRARSDPGNKALVEEALDAMYLAYSGLFGASPEVLREMDETATRQDNADDKSVVKSEEYSPLATLLVKALVEGVNTRSANYLGLGDMSAKFLRDVSNRTAEYSKKISETATQAMRDSLRGEYEGDLDILRRQYMQDFIFSGLAADRNTVMGTKSFLERLAVGVPNSEIPLSYLRASNSRKSNFNYTNPLIRRMEAAREEFLAKGGGEHSLNFMIEELDAIVRTKGGAEVPTWKYQKYALPENMTTRDMRAMLEQVWDNGVDTYPHWVGAFGDKDRMMMVHMPKITDLEKVTEKHAKMWESFSPAIRRKIFPADSSSTAEILRRAENEKLDRVQTAYRLNYSLNQMILTRQIWGDHVLERLKSPSDLIKRMGLALSSGPTMMEAFWGKDHIRAVTVEDPMMLTSHDQAILDQKALSKAGLTQKDLDKLLQEATDGFALIPEATMEKVRESVGESITRTRDWKTGEERDLKLLKAVHAGPNGMNKFGAATFTREYAESIENSALIALFDALEYHNAEAEKELKKPPKDRKIHHIDMIFFGSTDKARQEIDEDGRRIPVAAHTRINDFYPRPTVNNYQEGPISPKVEAGFTFDKTFKIPLQDFYWLLPADHHPEPEESNLPLQLLPIVSEFGFPAEDLVELQQMQLTDMLVELEAYVNSREGIIVGDSAKKSRKLEDRIRGFLREDAHPWMEVIKEPIKNEDGTVSYAFPLHSRFTEAAAVFNEAKFLQKEIRVKGMVVQAVEQPAAAPLSSMPDFKVVDTPDGERTRLPRLNVNVGSGGRSTYVMNGGEITLGDTTTTTEALTSMDEVSEFLLANLGLFLDMFEVNHDLLDRNWKQDSNNWLRNAVANPEMMAEAIAEGQARIRVEEIDWLDGYAVLPGSPVLIQRVPSDNNYSATMVRINKKVPGEANAIITSFDRQIKAGPDFDIDKRFVMTMHSGKKAGLTTNGKWGKYNRFMLKLTDIYADPKNLKRVNNTLDHDMFGDIFKEGAQEERERLSEMMQGVPSSPEGMIAAYQANVMGKQGLGRVATSMYGANLMNYAGVGFKQDYTFEYEGTEVTLNAVKGEPRNFDTIKDALGLLLNKYTDHANLQEIDKIGGNVHTASVIALMFFGNNKLTNVEELKKYMYTIKEILQSPEVQAWVEQQEMKNSMLENAIFGEKSQEADWHWRAKKLRKARIENPTQPLTDAQKDPEPNRQIYDVLLKLTDQMFETTMAMRGNIKVATTSIAHDRNWRTMRQVLRNTTGNPDLDTVTADRMIQVPRINAEPTAEPDSKTIPSVFRPSYEAASMLGTYLFDSLPYNRGVGSALKKKIFFGKGSKTQSDNNLNKYQQAVDTIIATNGLLRGNFSTQQDLMERILAELDRLQKDADFVNNAFIKNIGWNKATVNQPASVYVLMKDADIPLYKEYDIQRAFSQLPFGLKNDLLLYTVSRYGAWNFLTSTGSFLRWVDPAFVSGRLGSITRATDEFLSPPDASGLHDEGMFNQMVGYIRDFMADSRTPYSPENHNRMFDRPAEFDQTAAARTAEVLASIRIENVEERARTIVNQTELYRQDDIAFQEQNASDGFDDTIPPEVVEELMQKADFLADHAEMLANEKYKGQPMSPAHALVNASFRYVKGESGKPLTREQKDEISDLRTRYTDLVDRLASRTLKEEDAKALINDVVKEKEIRDDMLAFNKYRLQTEDIKKQLKSSQMKDKVYEERKDAFFAMLMAEEFETTVEELDRIAAGLDSEYGYSPEELTFSLRTFDYMLDTFEEDEVTPNHFKNRLIKTTRGVRADVERYSHWAASIRDRVGASRTYLDPVLGWKDRPGNALLQAITVLLEHPPAGASDPAAGWSLESIKERSKSLYIFTESEEVPGGGFRAVEKSKVYVADIIEEYEVWQASQPQGRYAEWEGIAAEIQQTFAAARNLENMRVGMEDWIPNRENFVPHIFRRVEEDEDISIIENASESARTGGIRKRKSGATLVDAMHETGRVPVSWDITDLFERWLRVSTETSRKRIMLEYVGNTVDVGGRSGMIMDMADPERANTQYPLLNKRTGWKMLRSLHMQLTQLRRDDVRDKYPIKKIPNLNMQGNPWSQLSHLMNEVANPAVLRALGYKQMKYHSLTGQVSQVWAMRGAAYKSVEHAISSGLRERAMMAEDPWKRVMYSILYGIKTFNQFIKQINVGISFFHHIALLESVAADEVILRTAIPGVSFIRYAMKGAAMYKEMVQDPEIAAQWRGAGLQVSVRPEEIRNTDPKSAQFLKSPRGIFRQVGRFLNKKKGFRWAGDAMLTMTNVWNMADNLLWTGMVPVMKIRMAERMFTELRRMPKNANVSDAALRSDVSRYVNDALGGQEWEQTLWATPFVRDMMNVFWFAPDWTISALRISGVPQLSGHLLGQSVDDYNTHRPGLLLGSPVQQRKAFRYWPSFMFNIFFWLPMQMQALIYLSFGGGEDEDDRMWSWENEGGFFNSIDITPLMRKVQALRGVPVERRYYMSLGKQGREIMHWIEPGGFISAAFGKSSTSVRMAAMLTLGIKTLNWNPSENWTVPDNERLLGALKIMTPFSASAAFADDTPWLTNLMAPIKKGSSVYALSHDLAEVYSKEPMPWQLIDANSKWEKFTPDFMHTIESRIDQIWERADRNDLSKKAVQSEARSIARLQINDAIWKKIARKNPQIDDELSDLMARLYFLERDGNSVRESLDRSITNRLGENSGYSGREKLWAEQVWSDPKFRSALYRAEARANKKYGWRNRQKKQQD